MKDIYGVKFGAFSPADNTAPRSPLASGPAAGAGAGVPPAAPWWLLEAPDLFRDTTFYDDQWQRHHSWLRHLPEPARFFLVLLGMAPVVLWVLLTTSAVGLYAELLQGRPGWPTAVATAYIEPFVLTSFALGLLLVFRTTSSYDRWWEARKAFGSIYNYVRNVCRMVSPARWARRRRRRRRRCCTQFSPGSFLRRSRRLPPPLPQTLAWLPPEEAALGAEVVRWMSVLCAAATAFLRDDPSLLDAAEGALSPDELAWLRRASQPPVAAAQVVSALLRRSSLSPYERAAIEAQLSAFDISVGALERIRSQTIPLAYTRHTSRFIITYLTFLPFGLWAYTRWLTIPIMATVAFLLLGIENIGGWRRRRGRAAVTRSPPAMPAGLQLASWCVIARRDPDRAALHDFAAGELLFGLSARGGGDRGGAGGGGALCGPAAPGGGQRRGGPTPGAVVSSLLAEHKHFPVFIFVEVSHSAAADLSRASSAHAAVPLPPRRSLTRRAP
jgi:predicted membrane chloride channel (bestrophin family)